MEHTESFSGTTLAELAAQLADPQTLAGGGVAAAACAALASSLAELVVRLSLRRRANQAFQAVICEDADRLLELRHDLFRAADRDATAFVNLMGAQRVAASTGDRAAYRVALSEAARSPIELAALALEVAVIAERRIPNAARFAASDLTAGIAICYGVVAAALATARINVALLADEQTAEMQELAKDLQAQCQALGRRAQGLTPIFATALYSDADARS